MSVHVVRGDDPILRADVVSALIGELVGSDDRALGVEDLTVPPGKGSDEDDARAAVVATALNAADSPPFMTARRVVVLRDVGNLTTKEAAPVVTVMAALLDTTELVLVAGGGKVPETLTKAWKAAKAREHAPAQSKPDDVLAAALDDVGLALRPDAIRAITLHVGNEVGRIPGIVAVLVGAFDPGERLSAEDVAPYLGEQGGVAPWRLTQAIEDGDVANALVVLRRLLTASGPQQPKPMHPLQVLAMLHNHYRRVARLDDAEVQSTADAAAALGGRVREFQAEKALRQSRALGPDGIRTAYDHLAQADLDLKGTRAIPEDAVMEILVARLAALSGRSSTRPTRRPARGRRG